MRTHVQCECDGRLHQRGQLGHPALPPCSRTPPPPPLSVLLASPAPTATPQGTIGGAGAGRAADVGALRYLNLHEYQSKDLMEKYGVQVQRGRMAASAKEAGEIARWIKKTSK
jgi:hypothetical protein